MSNPFQVLKYVVKQLESLFSIKAISVKREEDASSSLLTDGYQGRPSRKRANAQAFYWCYDSPGSSRQFHPLR